MVQINFRLVILMCLILIRPLTAYTQPTEASVKYISGYEGLDNQTNCTGTFVSPDGYMVTALHCFNDLNTDGFESLASRLGTGIVFKFDPQNPANGYAYSPIKSMGLAKSKVILVGKGSIFMEPNYNSLTPQDVITLKDLFDDFIILKFPKREKPYPCVQVTEKNPPVGAPIYHLGFPFIGPLAKSPKISRADGTFQLKAPPVINSKGENVAWAKMVIPGRFNFSTARTWSGFSGGGVYDQNGKYLGLTSFAVTKASVGAFVSTQQIVSSAKRVLGNAYANRIFSCGAVK